VIPLTGKSLLGWRISREGEYRINLPQLSEGEERLVLTVEAAFRAEALEKLITEGEVLSAMEAAVKSTASAQGNFMDAEQMRYLPLYAKMHIYGFAFLDELLSDDSIEEISVPRPGACAYVYVRKKGWQSVNASFESEKAVMDVTNRLARGAGRRITFQNPRLDSMLPDGSRLHASISPVSPGEITIRKFRKSSFSPPEIADSGVADFRALAFLSMLMQSDCPLMVAGNTASGKTTTLNALFSFVPANERILITEETPEISVPHAHQIRLVANKEMGITLKDLVYDSLRMRPDRMIVGEVRNSEEAEALFDVLLGGQARGAYCTFHAQSSQEALLRLGSFGIGKDDLQSIGAIIIQRRMQKYSGARGKGEEVRRICEISEVVAGRAEPAFGEGRLLRQKGRLARRMCECLGISEGELDSEISRRAQLMEKSPRPFSGFFKFWQSSVLG
jgi:Flp pilus assembly CpaF family ATPase